MNSRRIKVALTFSTIASFLVALILLAALTIPRPGPKIANLRSFRNDKVASSILHKNSIVRIQSVGCKEKNTIQLGSGVITDDGWIITAKHAVEGSSYIEIETWDGYFVEVEKTVYIPDDLNMDVAWIKTVDPPPSPLSLDEITPKIGSTVNTIGFPGGNPITESPGKVVRLKFSGGDEIPIMYETSSKTTGGSSGSPVVNSKDKIVGISVAVNPKTGASVVVNGAAIKSAFNGKIEDHGCND